MAGERDKALRQITELKEEMITLRSNIRMLTSERDNIDALYLQVPCCHVSHHVADFWHIFGYHWFPFFQVTDEVKRLRSEKSEQLISESNDVLRHERDTAITKLKQVIEIGPLKRADNGWYYNPVLPWLPGDITDVIHQLPPFILRPGSSRQGATLRTAHPREADGEVGI